MSTEKVLRKIFNNATIQWRLDSDGMLRCTTNVIRKSVLPYSVEDVGEDVPEELKDRETIYLYLPDDELEKAESLQSLEGKPIALDHKWQIGGSINSVGSVAGQPTYDKQSGFLMADILVTDPYAIKRITDDDGPEKLIEQSAAYKSYIDWTPGRTDDGQYYDGIQRDIKYNHIALLPEGKGRAGKEVRILNKDMRAKMSEYTSVKIGNSRVRVLNEDVDKLEDEMDKKDKEVKNADNKDEEKMKETQNSLEETKENLQKMKNENDGLKAEISTLKNAISESKSSTVMANAINKALEDQKTSMKILNSFAPNISEKEKEEIKNVYGDDLKREVINKVRMCNSKEKLTDEEAESSSIVNGIFSGLSEASVLIPEKKQISGAKVAKLTNSSESKVNIEKLFTEEAKAERIAKKFAQYSNSNS